MGLSLSPARLCAVFAAVLLARGLAGFPADAATTDLACARQAFASNGSANSHDLKRDAAVRAGLHYGRPPGPGIRREPSPDGMRYFDGQANRITDRQMLARIDALHLPAAYHGVWISDDPESHLQATGLDDKNRLQYRYHPKWITAVARVKFARMSEFGGAIGGIRRSVSASLGLPGLPREKVLAAAVRLLERTSIRVGNEEYAEENGTYGLTTLLHEQVSVSGNEIRLRFVGKKSVAHDIRLEDPELALVLARLLALPGGRVFQVPEQSPKGRSALLPVSADQVNQYLKDIGQGAFTAKDFRTWGGTTSAARSLINAGVASTPAAVDAAIQAAVASAAVRLGNTPAVCRESYIDPSVLEAYAAGEPFQRALAQCRREIADSAAGPADLSIEELVVLHIREACAPVP